MEESYQAMLGVQMMVHVILPQAIRNMLPALVTQFIVLFKDTSLASIIGVMDLTKAAQIVSQREIRPFEMYLFLARGLLGLRLQHVPPEPVARDQDVPSPGANAARRPASGLSPRARLTRPTSSPSIPGVWQLITFTPDPACHRRNRGYLRAMA
jgi:hypothetical protein